MANHLLTIDPILLMDETQIAKLDTMKNSGEAADYISKQLGDQFEFSQVFQSTNNEHTLNVHEFMFANETGERKMHDMGTMKTPSDLLSFVSVSDEWIKEHKDVINKGVHFKMDERIDPKLLQATDGQTEDGQTTSFLRYGQYSTPIMMVAPNGPITYQDESVEDMEKLANEREDTLRDRKFSLDPFRFLKREHEKVKKESVEGAFLDGVLKGWDLIDNYKKVMGNNQEPNANVQPSSAPNKLNQLFKSPTKETNTPEFDTPEFNSGLQELSEQVMQDEQFKRQRG